MRVEISSLVGEEKQVSQDTFGLASYTDPFTSGDFSLFG